MNNFTEILKKCETYEQLCIKKGALKIRPKIKAIIEAIKPHFQSITSRGLTATERAAFRTSPTSFFEMINGKVVPFEGVKGTKHLALTNETSLALTNETIQGLNDGTITAENVARELAYHQETLKGRQETLDGIGPRAEEIARAGTPLERAKLVGKRALAVMSALGTLYLLFSGKNPTTDNPAKKVIIDDVKNSSIKSSNPETKEVIENYNKLNSMLTTLISSANETVKLTEKDKVVLMLFISKNNEIITALNDLGGTDLSLDDVSQLRSFAAKVSSLETKLSKHEESLGKLKEILIKTNRSGMAEICGLAIDHSSKYIESIKDQRSKLQGIA